MTGETFTKYASSSGKPSERLVYLSFAVPSALGRPEAEASTRKYSPFSKTNSALKDDNEVSSSSSSSSSSLSAAAGGVVLCWSKVKKDGYNSRKLDWKHAIRVGDIKKIVTGSSC